MTPPRAEAEEKSEYELERERNIRRNNALLNELGLYVTPSKKRNNTELGQSLDPRLPTKKQQRTKKSNPANTQRRWSSRIKATPDRLGSGESAETQATSVFRVGDHCFSRWTEHGGGGSSKVVWWRSKIIALNGSDVDIRVDGESKLHTVPCSAVVSSLDSEKISYNHEIFLLAQCNDTKDLIAKELRLDTQMIVDPETIRGLRTRARLKKGTELRIQSLNKGVGNRHATEELQTLTECQRRGEINKDQLDKAKHSTLSYYKLPK